MGSGERRRPGDLPGFAARPGRHSQIFAVHGPTISRIPEWTPAGEITGPHALRLADVIEQRAGLGSPEECVIVDFAEALARSGRLGAV